MGDTDGSSRAAQSAQPENGGEKEKAGLFSRIVDAFSPPSEEEVRVVNGHEADKSQSRGMINLRRMRVEDVAIPTAEIISVPSTISKEELAQVFRDSGLSRIPVYEGTLDTPLGFVHLKDFALTHGFNGGSTEFDLVSMLRTLLFVPPSMPIGVLMTKMQTERRHMALVIDEYGGVDGLLTIEDLIEQVVGEIADEHDADESQLWVQEKAGCYIVQARVPLEEFEAEIGRSLTSHEDVDEEEIDTLGGLVFMLSGRVPALPAGCLSESPGPARVISRSPITMRRSR